MTENYTLSDIAAVTDGNRNNGMFGNDSWAWIVILLLFGYGRGFGGFGGFGGGFGGGCGAPCATQADVRAAVDQQTLISKLDQQTYGLADSTYAINNTINSNFRGVDNAICNLGYNVQSGFNTLGHQLSDCCCATQRAIDSVKYENATNTCAIQNTIQNTTRDVIDNANANSRAILDFLVQDKLASKDARIAQLENKLSQSEQNAFISATIDASQATLIRRLGADCPTPAYVVQPPQPVTFPTNCCGQVNYAATGCGCNGGF
jgi:hypothetical protein